MMFVEGQAKEEQEESISVLEQLEEEKGAPQNGEIY